MLLSVLIIIIQKDLKKRVFSISRHLGRFLISVFQLQIGFIALYDYVF